MMRRLEQKISRVVQAGVRSALKPIREFRDDLDVGAMGQEERDVGMLERDSQLRHVATNAIRTILEQPWVDMRRAGSRRDAVGEGDTRHLERDLDIRRAIVDAWQQVTVEVDHVYVLVVVVRSFTNPLGRLALKLYRSAFVS
jgi:hypothetical protein